MSRKELTGRMRLRQHWADISMDIEDEKVEKHLVLQVEESWYGAEYCGMGKDHLRWRDALIEDFSLLPNPFVLPVVMP